MPIYEFAETDIFRLDETTFNLAGLQERRDLQRLLREHIEVIAPNSLVIAEEFGDWDESRRRIDLLAIDKEANLVVIELKRTEDGGHMELQSIRYASMVSTMTFDQAANAFGQYLKQIGKDDQDPRSTVLDFLGWDEPDDDQFAQDVRIVLASADFSKELTLPIRLTPMTATCRVPPLSRVEFGIGWSGGVARDAEQRAEGVERVKPPVEGEL